MKKLPRYASKKSRRRRHTAVAIQQHAEHSDATHLRISYASVGINIAPYEWGIKVLERRFS